MPALAQCLALFRRKLLVAPVAFHDLLTLFRLKREKLLKPLLDQLPFSRFELLPLPKALSHTLALLAAHALPTF